jgi:hypothetical protein
MFMILAEEAARIDEGQGIQFVACTKGGALFYGYFQIRLQSSRLALGRHVVFALRCIEGFAVRAGYY